MYFLPVNLVFSSDAMITGIRICLAINMNKLGLSYAKLSLNWASMLRLPLIIIYIKSVDIFLELYETSPT